MNRLVVLTLVVLASVACGSRRERKPAPPPPEASAGLADESEGWQRLGERKVDWTLETDTIAVTASDAFSELRLHVQSGAVHLMDVKVHFADGQSYDASVRRLLERGGKTRVIELPGEPRAIKELTLTYRTVAKAKRGKATVTAWARQPAE